MRQLVHCIAILSLLSIGSQGRADDLDDFIRKQMQKRRIPGLSIAIIQDSKIVRAAGYGFIDKNRTTPVTPSTLFQAGSISKSVAAVGALHLTEEGKLSLDTDVNTKLKTWKVPENEFTKDRKVTLRGLLSHTAGLTVHGFPGYEAGTPIPTVVQILDGSPPANTPAVRVDFVPGTRWRYSGGGYTVMQQLITDVTDQPFPQFMQTTVLGPLAMTASTFQQPLPANKAKATATGHSGGREAIKGRWHIYPEMAAAGLWTTPSDLARFAIGIQNALAGKSGTILSKQMTQQMLTDQKDKDGLGVFLQGEGNTMRFGHNGRDEGFDALMTAGAQTGQGVVIMINANDNSQLLNYIVDEVAKKYHWTGYPITTTAKRVAVPVDAKKLTAYEGRYELYNNRMITLTATGDRLFTLVDGFNDEEFVPETATRFASTVRDAYLTFTTDAEGKVTELVWKREKEERKIPRIGPLFRSPKPTTDPDPARTHQLESVLNAMAQGGKAVADVTGVTPGVRQAFSQGAGSLFEMKPLTFIGAEDVSGRGIERHEGKVDQILTYKFGSATVPRYVLIYLTSDGLITDYDIVEK